jgi:hypothetical protein
MFCLNDYKPDLAKKRYPFIHPISIQSFDYNGISDTARIIVEKITPFVKESKLDDRDFGPFVEMLRANLAFSWRFHSSVY